MDPDPQHWLTAVDQLISEFQSLERPPEISEGRLPPLTFVLGAGASISSGAPSTRQVEDHLMEAKRFRSREEMYERVHELNKITRSAAVRRLFDDVTPYIGYQALACLGRRRQVIVLNLNWDRAVEDACRQHEARCWTFDLAPRELGPPDEVLPEVEQLLDDGQSGVIVLHLHGNLDGEMRFGRLETRRYDPEQLQLIHTCAQRPTIVVGTTLRSSDFDTADLLLALTGVDPRAAFGLDRVQPIWVLTRDTHGSDDYRKSPAQSALAGRGSTLNFVQGPQVDFDRLLVAMLAAERDSHWDELRNVSRAELPSWEELVYPAPDLLRTHLDSRVLVLTGNALLGKSTIAFVLAHWFWLLLDAKPETTKPETSSAKHLIPLIPWEASMRVRGELEKLEGRHLAAVIIDDPYGPDGHDPEAGFMEMLVDFTAGDGFGCPIIVTSRTGGWEADIASPADGLISSIDLVVAKPEEWYSKDALRNFADQRTAGAAARLGQRIENGELYSPFFVRTAAEAVTHNEIGNTAESVAAYHVASLREWWSSSDRPLAIVAIAVRLQQFDQSRGPGRMCAAAGIDRETVRVSARNLISQYWHDNLRWWRPDHYTVIDAIDRFLSETLEVDGEWMRGSDALLAEVTSNCEGLLWIQAALDTWETLARVRDGGQSSWPRLDGDQAREWGPTVLSYAVRSRPHDAWELVDQLFAHDHDIWSLSELTRTVVEVWQYLKSETKGGHFVDSVLRWPCGAYIVLEAVVKSGVMPSKRLLARVETAIYQACDARADTPAWRHHLALLFDCLCWRRGALSDDERLTLMSALLEAASSPDDPLWGAYATSCAYHLDGWDFLVGHGHDPADRSERFTDPQAEEVRRLVEWHRIYEARVRALMVRRNAVSYGADFELKRRSARALFPPARAEQQELAQRLVNRLHGTPRGHGTAILFVASLSNAVGEIEHPFLGSLPPPTSEAPAVAAATLSHAVLPPVLQGVVRRYFGVPANREALLDQMVKGVEFEGVQICQPRFIVVEDPPEVYKRAHIGWPALRALGLGDEEERAEREGSVWRLGGEDCPPKPCDWSDTLIAAEDAAWAGPPLDSEGQETAPYDVWETIAKRASQGDLRDFENVASDLQRAAGDDTSATVKRLITRVASTDSL